MTSLQVLYLNAYKMWSIYTRAYLDLEKLFMTSCLRRITAEIHLEVAMHPLEHDA